jgi:hypothetical protein
VFHDPVAKKDIGAILSSADCFVASVRKSRLNEFGISPNKLNDYLAAGRPVVLGAQAANNPVSESGDCAVANGGTGPKIRGDQAEL